MLKKCTKIVGKNGDILVIGLYAFFSNPLNILDMLSLACIFTILFFFVFSFVSIEKIYRTLNTVFHHHISENLKIPRQNHSTTRRNFNSLLGCLGYVVKLGFSCLIHHSTSYVTSFTT